MRSRRVLSDRWRRSSPEASWLSRWDVEGMWEGRGATLTARRLHAARVDVPCSCASLGGAQEPLVVQCDSLFIYNIYIYTHKTVSSSQQQTFTLKAFHCLSLWVDEVIMCRIPGGREGDKLFRGSSKRFIILWHLTAHLLSG